MNIADRRDVDGNPVSLHQLVLMEPDWACDKIRALEAENAELKREIRRLKDKLLEYAI